MKKTLLKTILFLVAVCLVQIAKAQPDIKHSLYIKEKKCYQNKEGYAYYYQHSKGSVFAITGKRSSGITFDAVLAKMNANLDTVWSKTFGGSNDDNLLFISELKNGNLLLTGTSNSYDGDVWYGHSYTGREIWVMEVDTNGVFKKGKNFGGSNGSELWNVKVSTDGDIYLVGTTAADDYDFTHLSFGFLDTDGWTAKLDSNLTIKWIKFQSGNSGDATTSIEEVNNNRFIVSVGTSSTNIEMLGPQGKGGADLLAIYIDSNGNDVWRKRYGSSNIDFGQKCFVLNNIIYFVSVGGGMDGDITYNTGGQGISSMWMLKIDTIGNIIASKGYGDTSYGNTFVDAQQINGSIWVTNSGPGQGGDIDMSVNPLSDNGWIGMIDTNANLVGKYTINGNGSEGINNIFKFNNDVCVNGSTTSYSPNLLGCNPATDTLFGFVFKIGVAPLSIKESNLNKQANLFKLYPNPTQHSIHIEMFQEGKYELIIYSTDGKVIYKTKSKQQHEQIDCDNWQSGNYVIKIVQNKQTQTQTFIKQ